MSYPDLTGFKALSFDCYGTLIDWEPGMVARLRPIVSRLPPDLLSEPNPVAMVQRLHKISAELQAEEPLLRYKLNLSQSFRMLAEEFDVSVTEEEANEFGSQAGAWVPFEDVVTGLEILKKYYRLIILSNIDNDSMAETLEHFKPSVEFDAVYTAEQIGSYKPAYRNFEYLFDHARRDLGINRENGDLLHVARSLTADHVTTKQIGLRSVWISRGGEKQGKQGVGGDYDQLKSNVAFEWRFDTIGDFAQEVDRQFRGHST